MVQAFRILTGLRNHSPAVLRLLNVAYFAVIFFAKTPHVEAQAIG